MKNMFGLSSVTSGAAVEPQAPATSPSAVEPARGNDTPLQRAAQCDERSW